MILKFELYKIQKGMVMLTKEVTVPFLLTCFIAEKRLEVKKPAWNNE